MQAQTFHRVRIGLGIVLIIAATLNMTSAGYGTSVRREFRRSYDMIKNDVHAALPRTVLLGGLGLLLLVGFRRPTGGDSEENSQ